MRVNKAVDKKIRITGRGMNLVGDVNAAIVVGSAEKKGAHSAAHASSRQRIEQRRGRTGSPRDRR